MIIRLVSWLSAAAVLGGGASGAAATAVAVIRGGGSLDALHAQLCVTDAQRAEVRSLVRERSRSQGAGALVPEPSPRPFRFFPQGGTLWRDLFPNNFVDLDSSSGIRDWHCTDFTYNGHRGVDSDILSFPHQEIGVPVFAALDGTVTAAHDGEFDQNTEWRDAPANYVVIDHGGSHYTYYWHLKKGSVLVRAGDQVAAGQQIGLTGSSGFSTGPHLHFEAEFAGTHYEPFAGPCRYGPSGWETQIPFDDSLHVRELVLTRQDLGDWAGPLFAVERTGTFLSGTGRLTILMRLSNLPAGSSHRIRILRPDGGAAHDTGELGFGSAPNPFYRSSYWWYTWLFEFDATGEWKIEYRINGALAALMPLRVVDSEDKVTNRPPYAVEAAMDPPRPVAGEVLFCRVTPPGPFGDPDYDIVRYRYVWTVNGVTVRNIVSAGQADALSHVHYGPGDTVECRVTPGDGKADGPAVTASARVAGSGLAPRQGLSIATGGTGYQEMLYNYVTGEVAITPYQAAPARVERPAPRNQWTGVYHYDYAAGRFSQALYSARDGL